MLCMNYLGIMFAALTLHNLSFFMTETYCFVPIGILLALGYSRSTNMVGRARKLQAKIDANKPQEAKKDK